MLQEDFMTNIVEQQKRKKCKQDFLSIALEKKYSVEEQSELHPTMKTTDVMR